ncbi:MAG: hypothetical protein R2750_12320 [Bacteroidales bacterium]
MRTIYLKLNLPGFEESKSSFEEYINSMKDYKKNKHTIEKETIDKVIKNWGFSMAEWNYDLPGNMEII